MLGQILRVFLFLIKKMFFDMWDNLITIILLNVLFIVFMCILLLPIPLFLSFNIFYLFIYIAFITFVISLILGIISRYTIDISNYEKPGIKLFFTYFKESFKNSTIYFLFIIILSSIIAFVFPYYILRGTIIDLILCGIVFWTTITLLLASTYYLPISGRLNKGIKKNIKNSFLLLFDNTILTILMALGSIIIFIISFFTLFLAPGIATMTLWFNVGLKMLLYKYDYIEANPNVGRKNIPWNELIMEDEKKVGKRTLKGMIFPWKE